MADSTVLVTVVPHMFRHESVCLAHTNRKHSKAYRFLKNPSSLVSLESYQVFLPSLISYLTAWRCLSVENSLYPSTYLINSVITYCKLSKFTLDEVTGFCSPRPDFLNFIALIVSTMVGRDFDFPKKRRGKKFFQRSFSTPANVYPVFFVTCYKNKHSDWIARTTAA